jgi:hypothetical protein
MSKHLLQVEKLPTLVYWEIKYCAVENREHISKHNFEYQIVRPYQLATANAQATFRDVRKCKCNTQNTVEVITNCHKPVSYSFPSNYLSSQIDHEQMKIYTKFYKLQEDFPLYSFN